MVKRRRESPSRAETKISEKVRETQETEAVSKIQPKQRASRSRSGSGSKAISTRKKVSLEGGDVDTSLRFLENSLKDPPATFCRAWSAILDDSAIELESSTHSTSKHAKLTELRKQVAEKCKELTESDVSSPKKKAIKTFRENVMGAAIMAETLSYPPKEAQTKLRESVPKLQSEMETLDLDHWDKEDFTRILEWLRNSVERISKEHESHSEDLVLKEFRKNISNALIITNTLLHPEKARTELRASVTKLQSEMGHLEYPKEAKTDLKRPFIGLIHQEHWDAEDVWQILEWLRINVQVIFKQSNKQSLQNKEALRDARKRNAELLFEGKAMLTQEAEDILALSSSMSSALVQMQKRARGDRGPVAPDPYDSQLTGWIMQMVDHAENIVKMRDAWTKEWDDLKVLETS